MLEELDINDWSKVAQLFNLHILARSIINPCAQSGIGSLIVDNAGSPSVAKYSIPMMIFLAGDTTSSAAKDLIKSLPPLTMFIVPDEKWRDLLKDVWGKKLIVNRRTHLDHNSLDLEHLRELKKELPEGYLLKKIDYEVLPQINQEYTIQILSYLGKIRNLVETGIGFCILQNDKLVSYAYTPFPFTDEFEIQVFTENAPEYRRKGLATVVSATLIEYGLENNLV
ncbi:MAG: GNAT family N-acetyltransferase, partial [Candidatus Thorarchaeota archaeon]|nr:GNAT family N-acetyltransferase [Candidatus Thorarchaeota archaeon]